MTAAATSLFRHNSNPKPTAMKASKKPSGNVSRPLVEKAVENLLTYHEKQAEKSKTVPLLGLDAPIQVQFTLEIAPKEAKVKPMRVMIPHPFQKVSKDDDEEGLEEPEVCLIVKESSKEEVKELISHFPEQMGFIKKVLGLESLRKKHKTFSQRRELLKKYTMFMADDRILPMLTKDLGRDFIKNKKQPIPVVVSRKEALPVAIQKALSATFMFLSRGNCITIRAGNTGMPAEKLVDNILAIAGSYSKDPTMGAVNYIPRKWANVNAIGIKTPDSTSLPVYNKAPEELMAIAEMAGLDSVWKEPRKRSREETDEKVQKLEAKAAEEKKRKIEKAKSPLVRALKKSKEEKEQKKRDLDSKTNVDESPPKKTKKSKTKKPKEAGTPVKKSEDEKPLKSSSKKTKEETPKASSKKTKEETPKASSKKAKEETPKASSKKSKADDSPEKKSKESFVASKKFKGSKKGYMFQKGSKGLGYYLDAKPVVDRMAMEAFARAAKQRKKSPGGRKSGGGNKRRGRR